MSEHVLGASDDIDEFVRAFVEKRKASDYLRVGAANVCRFAASDIAEYKATFKKVKRRNGARERQHRTMYVYILNYIVPTRNGRTAVIQHPTEISSHLGKSFYVSSCTTADPPFLEAQRLPSQIESG